MGRLMAGLLLLLPCGVAGGERRWTIEVEEPTGLEDAVRGVSPDQFNCPGSVIRIQVDTSKPLGFGMARESGAFFARGAAFDLVAGAPGAEGARVIARYADKDVLMSGWLEGEGAIAGRAAVVEARRGSCRVVLYGIRPQYRAQSLATFRLLFNTLFEVPR